MLFRSSPYSYLATGRLVGIQRRFDVDLRVRPVLPIAVRIPGFFEQVNPLWPPYLLRDCMRIAEYHGIDFGWPRPDPIVQDFMTRKVADEQPYIHRLTRLGQLAAERGKGLAFVDEVSKIIWNGQVVGWHEGSHLADAAARAGCDLAEMDAVVEREGDRLHAVIEQNQREIGRAHV